METTFAWITDPHFDHAKLDTWQQWSRDILDRKPDALIVTGDLSEGEDVSFQLRCMAETFDRPIHFVLGNHDFYGGSIANVRRRVVDLCRDVPHLNYLTDSGPVPISDHVVMIGEDGWGDGTVGDYEGSLVRLNDFVLIEDFHQASPSDWKTMLLQQGHQSAERLRVKLDSLDSQVRHVLVPTHVPRFREACWYEGKTTDDHWAPFFVCGQVGDVLRQAASANPDRQYVVLCGHTHHEGTAQMADNLIVHTGYSRYGTLELESIIQITDDEISVPREIHSPADKNSPSA